MPGSRRFHPVYIARGICNSGKLTPPKSFPLASDCGTRTGKGLPILGGSKLTIPIFHCGPKSRWYARLASCGVLTPGIFGKFHLLKGTSVASAILGCVLGGGGVPSFTH